MKQLLFGLALLLFFSCEQENLGGIMLKEHDVEAFTGLILKGQGNAFLHVASSYRVEIVTNEQIHRNLDLSVRNGILTIDIDLSNSEQRALRKLEYHVYAPTFDQIKLKGVGTIKNEDAFQTENLEVLMNDVGDIVLTDIEVAQEITATVDGTGNIELSGVAELGTYELKNTGNIKAFDLQLKDCKAEMANGAVGDIKCSVSNDLKATARGVGTIFYKGDPSVEKSETTTAKVRKV